MTIPLLVVQGLAFLKGFTLLRALVVSGLLLPVMAGLYVREGFPPLPASPRFPRPLAWLLWTLLGLWLAVLVLFPVVFWPRTRLGVFLPWDLIYYHLPKAADLVQRGDMWNLALPYGQYPLGWEGLLALSMGWSGTAEGVGPAMGLALVGLGLGLMLLLQREGKWPMVGAGVVVPLMFFSFHLPFPGNPWRVLGLVVAESLGKNDVFAAALVLGALYHLPLSLRPAPRGHGVGYALTLAAAFATKPHSGLMVLGLGLMAWWWSSRRRRAWRWDRVVVGGLSLAVGLLWLVRNLLLLGRPFSPIVAVLQRRAVMMAVWQPSFWQPWPKTFLLLGAFLALLTLVAWRRPAWRRPVAAAWWLVGVWSVTPAGVMSAGRIDWRFGLAPLLWAWVLVLAGGTAILRHRRWAWAGRPGVVLVLGGLTLGGGLWTGVRYAHFLSWEPQYGHVLYDPFPEPVGVGGYRSVFDYLDREVRYGTIHADGVPFFYLYDPAWTNRPVRPRAFPSGMPRAVPQPVPDHWLYCAVRWDWRHRAYPEDPDRVRRVARRWARLGRDILYQDAACVLARKSPAEK